MVTATVILVAAAALALSWAAKAACRFVSRALAPVDPEGAPSQLAR